jgi:hypothetical protein
MLLKGIMAAVAFSLTGLFGCSKPAAPSASAPSAAVAQSKVKDLGVLQMTNDYETCVKFGANRSARIVPRMIDRHNVRITLTVESKDAAGKTSGLSIVQMTGDAEKQFEISIGDTDFTFTPQIASAN